ncbi:hypothetical protein QEZ48_07580 [Aquamicrobium lusatiense]|uniref:hypothetical protein n=1 Tax=Aquamicrobium lusatiense TaxID=89772 RepID=UPI0024558E1F|nr:hypothetical protein [Aquamicrobium lusatiense]MDH4990690.1 hypothetical protein [Aquamicrobium lusatiense]
MLPSIFSQKLDTLGSTVALIDELNLASLSSALVRGSTKDAYAIGSGGSLISSHYLASCRADITDRPTSVQTPMEFVLDQRDLSGSQVWLFSGRGENADVHAALAAARAKGCRDIHIVTSNPVAPVVAEAKFAAKPHVLPAFEEKDGFLSTHSLISVVAALLRATDLGLHGNSQPSRLQKLRDHVKACRDQSEIRRLESEFSSIGPDDTLIILSDPRLRAAAVALETSLWETALCPVQLTDFRNFAHGRHVWLHKRSANTFLLAMLGSHSSSSWQQIKDQLPTGLRQLEITYGDAGRFHQATAIVDTLMIIEALGTAQEVDPAKPGVGPTARAIYDGDALQATAQVLEGPVRHKLKANLKHDLNHGFDPVQGYQQFLKGLKEAHFGALVLDYDGTVVTTADRLKPPRKDILDELVRLLSEGLQIGFATGRGGSAGEMLRDHIPASYHQAILMGYYNGGYLQPLDIDIRKQPASEPGAIANMIRWLAERSDLLSAKPKVSGVQISITVDDSLQSRQLILELDSAPEVISGAVRIVRSGHSIDIGMKENTKLNVVEAMLPKTADNSGQILCIGDSGGVNGNDFELLGHSYGISVREVCHRPNVCWTIFGSDIRGPDALLTILKSMTRISNGIFQLDVPNLRE